MRTQSFAIRLSSEIVAMLLALTISPVQARLSTAARAGLPADRPCHFHHNLCVKPKHVKLSPNFGTGVMVGVPNGEVLASVQEADNCQGMATLTLQQLQENFSIWEVTALLQAPSGLCEATFTGVVSGKPVGPVTLKITILP